MARLTILLGIALILLGLGGYFGTGRESFTALIPVLFGLPLLILGLLALRHAASKVAMHIAVVIAVLGFAGTVRGLLKLPALLSRPEELERPAAVGVQSAMAVLCLLFAAACIGSFIAARRSAPRSSS
jgi:hypothetical protein